MKVLYRELGLILIVIALFSPVARAGGSKTESVEDQFKMGAADYKSFCAACHRTLTKLRKQRVIEIPQAQSIRILDSGRLEQLADGSFESRRTMKLLRAS